MQFGICTSVEGAAVMAGQGWDYVEPSVQDLLSGLVEDDQWRGRERAKASALPALCANLLVPASLKITGPDVDGERLAAYMRRVCARAATVGICTLVLGSGGARNVPEGFDQARARKQIVTFARQSARIAEGQGVQIVCEPLNRGECNIINSVAEAVEIASAVDHSGFACLVDSYHLWMENEPLENVERALPHIRHVHVADRAGRLAPGESGAGAEEEYRALFRVLKRGGYDRTISVEASGFTDIAGMGARVLGFLRRVWAQV